MIIKRKFSKSCNNPDVFDFAESLIPADKSLHTTTVEEDMHYIKFENQNLADVLHIIDLDESITAIKEK